MNTSNPSSFEANAKNLMSISLSINMVVGLPTNGYVVWLIVRGVGAPMSLEFFTLNLAISDILYCFSNVLHFVYLYFSSLGLLYFMEFSSCLQSIGRPLFQTFICLERYLAVVHPVVFLRYKPLRYRLACCVLLWAVIIISCCVSMFYGHIMRLAFRIYLAVYLFFVSINLFFGLSVLRALKQPMPGEGGNRGSDIKMKAFKIILVVLLSMVTYYLPWIVTVIASELNEDIELQEVGMVCFPFTVMAGFIHPLLYLHRTGRLPCITRP